MLMLLLRMICLISRIIYINNTIYLTGDVLSILKIITIENLNQLLLAHLPIIIQISLLE